MDIFYAVTMSYWSKVFHTATAKDISLKGSNPSFIIQLSYFDKIQIKELT